MFGSPRVHNLLHSLEAQLACTTAALLSRLARSRAAEHVKSLLLLSGADTTQHMELLSKDGGYTFSDHENGYRLPPRELQELIAYPPPPVISLSPTRKVVG